MEDFQKDKEVHRVENGTVKVKEDLQKDEEVHRVENVIVRIILVN